MPVRQFDIYCDVTQGVRPSNSDTPGSSITWHVPDLAGAEILHLGKRTSKENGARPSEGDGEMPQLVGCSTCQTKSFLSSLTKICVQCQLCQLSSLTCPASPHTAEVFVWWNILERNAQPQKFVLAKIA